LHLAARFDPRVTTQGAEKAWPALGDRDEVLGAVGLLAFQDGQRGREARRRAGARRAVSEPRAGKTAAKRLDFWHASGSSSPVNPPVGGRGHAMRPFCASRAAILGR
jgi:hypothetical protein